MDELVVTVFLAEDLEGAVGDDLVGVHIGRGAGAALDHVDREVLGVLAIHELLAGSYDGVGNLVGDEAEVVVGEDGAHLDDAEGLDELRMVTQKVAADIEVLDAAEGLYAEEGLCGNLLVAQQVVLGTGLAGSLEFVFDHVLWYSII